jgi:hypothetical protein
MIPPLVYQEKTRQVSSWRTTILTILLVLVATFVGSGCASYHRYRPTVVEYSGISGKGKDFGDMTDAAVVSYADRVRDTLRKRFHIARIARQSSSTAQVLLAGVAGIAAAFTAGATTVVSLTAGSVAMPQVAETFDAGARALAYQQAVAKISAAENAYFRARVGRYPVVPDNVLTVEGALLLEAINGATDAVELFQAGMLPTLEQMQRAEAPELKQRADGRTGETLPETSGVETPPPTPLPPRHEVGVITSGDADILVGLARKERELKELRKLVAEARGRVPPPIKAEPNFCTDALRAAGLPEKGGEKEQDYLNAVDSLTDRQKWEALKAYFESKIPAPPPDIIPQ